MKCFKCKNPITSKKDVAVAYWYTTIPIIQAYHIRCFDEINQRFLSGIAPAASLDLSRLNIQKIWNYITLIMPFILIVYLIVKGFNISLLEFAIAFLVIIGFGLGTIINLIIINKIEKLP